jgi:hypothetical protein
VSPNEATARAIAYFEQTDDMQVLRAALEESAPRVKRLVAGYLRKGTEEAIPSPAELRGAREAAPQAEALATLRKTQDFALLQAITRSIGRRIETMEIAASADFPVGVRVAVPSKSGYPRSGAELPGTVEETGTVLKVLLDNGETWQGPASLARLGGSK